MSRELSSPQRVATWLWLFKGPFFRSASRANLTTAPENNLARDANLGGIGSIAGSRALGIAESITTLSTR
jgi:hypothetical protein